MSRCEKRQAQVAYEMCRSHRQESCNSIEKKYIALRAAIDEVRWEQRWNDEECNCPSCRGYLSDDADGEE
jgi:hypothetical protein